MRKNADILNTIHQIKKTVEEFSKKSPSSIQYQFVEDMSYYVKLRLGVLKNSGLVGMTLVLLCLIAFLNLRTSLVTSLGAPLAFMLAFILMDSMSISINLITMFSLILVLGMLVDDSIVVAEQFYQKIEQGLPPKKAALEAALDTIRPVTGYNPYHHCGLWLPLFYGWHNGKVFMEHPRHCYYVPFSFLVGMFFNFAIPFS